jgi:hypothetical protein
MTEKNQGICFACAHVSSCALTSAGSALNGTQFCEEYEPAHFLTAIPLCEQLPIMLNRQTSSKTLGLCSNCAHYPGCSFPKPEGGVWHCEDYL